MWIFLRSSLLRLNLPRSFNPPVDVISVAPDLQGLHGQETESTLAQAES